MKSFLAAVAFLTRLPVDRVTVFDTADVAQSAGWFPVVGLLLGGAYCTAGLLLKDHLPLIVVAVLLVAFDAIATGGLHFDGLADTADGFGGGKDCDDVLRIMRDHAIGSYGGIALATIVAFKAAAYSALLAQRNWIAALVLAPALGRWSTLLLTSTLPYARPSPSVAAGMGRIPFLVGTVVMLGALVASRSNPAWIATLAVLGVTALFGLYCRWRIAGITGDTLGANIELCESAALVAFVWSGYQG